MLTASYNISKGSASMIHLWETVSSKGFISNIIFKSDAASSNEDRRRGFVELSGKPVTWNESILVSNLQEEKTGKKLAINIILKVFFKLKLVK